MKFECKPKLILEKEELDCLDTALKMVRDMDAMAGKNGCAMCPFNSSCVGVNCIYEIVHKNLKNILDNAEMVER